MGMSSGRRGGLNSEINVTPMVDVMLVLLIIFMVAAPMMQQTGVDLQLPQTEATIIPDEEGKLILSIDAKGVAYLSGQVIAWEELEVKLSTNEKVKVDGELYIEADTTLPYGQVLAAMATARRAGVSKLMMMTDPIEHGGPTK